MRQHLVVGHAKATGRKQVLPKAIVGERPRLSHQPVNDMPILDVVAPFASQTWQGLQVALSVPDFDRFDTEARFHPFANEASGHGIGIVAHPDRAVGADAGVDPLGGFQASGREFAQEARSLLASAWCVRH